MKLSISDAHRMPRSEQAKDLRAVWDGNDEEKFALMWSLSDGYGEPGLIPSQGYDWSGVRDSSPAAIRAMWNATR